MRGVKNEKMSIRFPEAVLFLCFLPLTVAFTANLAGHLFSLTEQECEIGFENLWRSGGGPQQVFPGETRDIDGRNQFAQQHNPCLVVDGDGEWSLARPDQFLLSF